MSRLIYFAGSIRAGRSDAPLYAKIVKELKKYGTVLTEHVGDPNITEAGNMNSYCTQSIKFSTVGPQSINNRFKLQVLESVMTLS